ncbi:MAG: glucose-6-phosphate isomerase [Methanomicrobiales archaeon]|jgi:glucose-6-phosphate isomerase|nr:glucose-6-phosphate isomerase [Methanomicrobiales archaeon]
MEDLPGWDGPLPEPDVRMAAEMRSILARPKCQYDGPLYLMYRDLAKDESERDWLASHNIRFDITHIPSRTLCSEYVKTKGHYHPVNAAGVGYPEVYEVLAGEALYLLQRRDLSDVVVIPARAGARIVIPPGYGHVTINSGDHSLVMSNLVSSAFTSQYAEYEELCGAAYYVWDDGRYTKNPAYPPNTPLVRTIRADQTARSDLLCPLPLIEMVRTREVPLFLNRPEEFISHFLL